MGSMVLGCENINIHAKYVPNGSKTLNHYLTTYKKFRQSRYRGGAFLFSDNFLLEIRKYHSKNHYINLNDWFLRIFTQLVLDNTLKELQEFSIV